MDSNISGIPDEASCRELMDRYSMLPNIVRHSYRVCQIALFVARGLNRQGAMLNQELIIAGSLLHDITKTRNLHTKENHSETGRDLLIGLGMPEVADIVARHVRLGLDNRDENSIGQISEAHIVNYSDKRVMHETVVSLEDRMEDLIVRYAKTPEARERIGALRELTFRLEDQIFGWLDFPPSTLDLFNTIDVFDIAYVPQDLSIP